MKDLYDTSFIILSNFWFHFHLAKYFTYCEKAFKKGSKLWGKNCKDKQF